jgi:outer membrane protein assembly factor BamD
MRFSPARALTAFRLLGFLFLLLNVSARADLVWTRETGWRVEGGALSGLTGPEGRNALDAMNRARADEERGSRGAAIKAYNVIARRYPNSIYAP